MTRIRAIFSPDRVYRYVWRRRCAQRGAPVAFCLLNPSTADEYVIDPTVTRACGYTRAWGGSETIILNAFAYRSTNPHRLYEVSDPIGPDNDAYLRQIFGEVRDAAGVVVLGWGEHGRLRDRSDRVLEILREEHVSPMCLHVNTGSGEPRHPLYLPRHLTPIPYTRPAYG